MSSGFFAQGPERLVLLDVVSERLSGNGPKSTVSAQGSRPVSEISWSVFLHLGFAESCEEGQFQLV
jgi:hypothetical protein